MADAIDRVSALAGLAQPGVYGIETTEPGVTLSERLPTYLVQVYAWPDTVSEVQKTLETKFNMKFKSGQAATSNDDVVAMPTGPSRWLIESEEQDLERMLRKLLKAEMGSVTGLNHGRAVINVRGERSKWVLATGIALDFHPSAFPIGDVRVTRHHEIGVTVHRTAEDAFDLYVFTSFARAFWQWLTTASGEVGYRIN